MSGDEPKEIHILEVDDRASFRRGDFYPELIYLSTVLRWSVNGNCNLEQADNTEKIVKNNDSALGSVGSLLAVCIESDIIPAFNAHSMLPIAGAEKESLVSRLKTMNEKDNLSGLAEIDAVDYFLGGKALFQFVMANAAPIDDDFRKGGLWWHLAWDAPAEWHTLINPGACKEDGQEFPPSNQIEAAPISNWMMRIQARASELWREYKKLGCSPTKNSIKGDLARWCRENDVTTDGGVLPTESYIYRHVIRQWSPPTN